VADESGVATADQQIAGVFVQSSAWMDPEEWEPADLAYMQAETQAALLGWLWSLRCPVVNRYPSSVWYRPQAPLMAWFPLLHRCGLAVPESLVTNVEEEARAFGRRLVGEELGGAIYGPLSGEARYLISREEDWQGLAALQRVTPVCLTAPHGLVQPACVVGERIVWEGEPCRDVAALEPALRRFVAAAGLNFVEVTLALSAGVMCVIAVEPHPRWQHFSDVCRRQIVEQIVNLLTADTGEVARPLTEARSQRRSA
jgi:hypothetical protein